jgi:hypothetical protein
MSRQAPNFVPRDFEGWSLFLQSIGKAEHVDDNGRRNSETAHIRNVTFPSALIGMSALRGTVHRTGSADSGYRLRVRGHFPSLQQADYVIQRAMTPVPPRNEDFWIGVTLDTPRLSLLFDSMWQPSVPTPTLAHLENPAFRYMRLEVDEYPALAGLIHAAAAQRTNTGSQAEPVLTPWGYTF